MLLQHSHQPWESLYQLLLLLLLLQQTRWHCCAYWQLLHWPGVKVVACCWTQLLQQRQMLQLEKAPAAKQLRYQKRLRLLLLLVL